MGYKMTYAKSIASKISDGDYENKSAYPVKEKYTTYFVYFKGSIIANGVSHENTTQSERASWHTLGYTVEPVFDQESFTSARNAYGNERQQLSAQFKADLEDDNGVVGNPKADMLYSKADERGRSGGYYDIMNAYEDMVDLIK